VGFIRVHLCLSVVALSGLLFAGCAEMRWSKPGADSARMEEDFAQCRSEARLHAERVSLPRAPLLPPTVGTDALGRPVPVPARARTEDPLLMEQDLTGACMRRKGYELVTSDR
jgi:hypothetical protein